MLVFGLLTFFCELLQYVLQVRSSWAKVNIHNNQHSLKYTFISFISSTTRISPGNNISGKTNTKAEKISRYCAQYLLIFSAFLFVFQEILFPDQWLYKQQFHRLTSSSGVVGRTLVCYAQMIASSDPADVFFNKFFLNKF